MVGAHLEGGPLHHQLAERGAVLVTRTRTAGCYRLYALPTEPAKPGLIRTTPGDEGAGAVEVEVWRLSPAAFGDFVDHVAAPMVIGRVLLEDGSNVAGFLCEPIGVAGAPEVTAWGGWRAYRTSLGDRW